jgi:hypothetical protein
MWGYGCETPLIWHGQLQHGETTEHLPGCFCLGPAAPPPLLYVGLRMRDATDLAWTASGLERYGGQTRRSGRPPLLRSQHSFPLLLHPRRSPRSAFSSCLPLWGSRQSAMTFRSCRILNSRSLWRKWFSGRSSSRAGVSTSRNVASWSTLTRHTWSSGNRSGALACALLFLSRLTGQSCWERPSALNRSGRTSSNFGRPRPARHLLVSATTTAW